MSTSTVPEAHSVQRVRHDTRRRALTVTEVIALTPKMRRVIFHSPELFDFTSLGVDDHVKLILTDGSGETIMRDFTPRSFDVKNLTLAIDFALHDAGPATDWAARAKIGDVLTIGGPRGSRIVPDDFDWYLLIGDETAMPALGRWLENLRADVPVTTLFTVDSLAEAQQISTSAAWAPYWICRDNSPRGDAELIRAKLEELALPEGDGYVWIAAESAVAKTLRTYLVDERMHNPRWMRASGYWRSGDAASHEDFE